MDIFLRGTLIRDVEPFHACDLHEMYRGRNRSTGRDEAVKIFRNRNRNSLNRCGVNHFFRHRDSYEEYVQEIQQVQDWRFWPQLFDCGVGELLESADGRVLHTFPMLRMEFCQGVVLADYLEANRASLALLLEVTSNLGRRLKELHEAGFGHGDPHLWNVLVCVQEGGLRILFTDVNMLHHRSFRLCRRFRCFTDSPEKRFMEDLQNNFTGRIGNGFRLGVMDFGRPLGIARELATAFDEGYTDRR